MLKAVFFDAFKTLVDLRPNYAGAFAELAQDFGQDVTVEQVERILPPIERKLYSVSKGPRGDYSCTAAELHARWIEFNRWIYQTLEVTGDPAEMAREMEARFNSGRYTVAYGDSLATLERLRERGLKLGIISNGTPGVLDCLRLLKFDARVDFILVSALVGWEKPAPQIFELAREKAGVSREKANVAPEEIVFVGDHYEADILGARAAGMRAIQILRNGQAPAGDVESIRDLSEIYSLLDMPSS